MKALTAAVLLSLVTAMPVAASEDAVESSVGPSASPHASWPGLVSGPLEDNSFLIEEAYNQEEGVIQHIFTVLRDQQGGNWLGSFTQEWPVPDERHQFSFTLPFLLAEESDSATSIGDLLLNYRYQLLFEDKSRPALAPRFSLIFPTGDYQRGIGTGSAGVQLNIPVSKQLTDKAASHLNLGATAIPEARAPINSSRTESLISWNGGGSFIWEPREAFNVLCEFVVSRDAEVARHGVAYRTRATLSPGIRIGWNGRAGIQWVWGVAAPIGLTRDTSDVGVFFYLSVEHGFTNIGRAGRQW